MEEFLVGVPDILDKKILAIKNLVAAREKGLVRTEGKDYIVRDGDVIEFLHG